MRSVVKLCVPFKKHEGLLYNTAMPPDLPSARVSDDPPFSHVGLDFASQGPLRTIREKGVQMFVHLCLHRGVTSRGWMWIISY